MNLGDSQPLPSCIDGSVLYGYPGGTTPWHFILSLCFPTTHSSLRPAATKPPDRHKCAMRFLHGLAVPQSQQASYYLGI